MVHPMFRGTPNWICQASWISALAMLGALSRQSLSNCEFFKYLSLPREAISSTVYANVIGCLLIGVAKTLPSVGPWQKNVVFKAWLGVFCTGFCGAITSYGSLVREEIGLLWDAKDFRVTKFVVHIFMSYASALCAYNAGVTGVLAFDEFTKKMKKSENRISIERRDRDDIEKNPTGAIELERISKDSSYYSDEYQERVETLSEIGIIDNESSTESDRASKAWKYYQIGCFMFHSIILALLLTPGIHFYYQNSNSNLCNDLLASSIAGVGAISRWLLSSFNTLRFPWGTFVANVVGTTLTVIVFELAIIYKPEDMFNWSTFISGGMLGSLSTMSTYISEISNLTPLKSVLYIMLTHLTCLVVAAIIVAITRSG